MKTIILWTLRIITMPFRLVIAIGFVASTIFIALPIGILFTIGSPEAVGEVWHTIWETDWKGIGRMVLFGF